MPGTLRRFGAFINFAGAALGGRHSLRIGIIGAGERGENQNGGKDYENTLHRGSFHLRVINVHCQYSTNLGY